ncbi:class A sortase [Bombilactobacillus thymidiniphilus]|uniref:Class A sortase n=1 Tax=Bombilactobacillus thymidiniphilus TaxID=2923363 RepID=A0ABY4PDB3_9LACO|nr:class A sortase [Bombilactobacillus thymidiniphilus]UQS83512.1 class A sortase [Bombilactobacillus thymidiniphilus]
MKRFWKWFGTILVVLVALILIFNAQIKGLMVKELAQEQLTSVTRKQIKQNELRDGSFNYSKVKPITAKQVVRANLKHNAAVLGKIAIPAVNLKLPIVKGMDDTALSTGAGTMKPDEKMGHGNYALAGHYMTQKGALFSPLEDTKIGDLVYITDLKNVYIYKITLKQIISPHATWMINDQKGSKLLSLVTCADGGANRWIVQGDLVQTQVANRATLSTFS